MVALFCWFGLLICLIFIFWHLVRPLGDGWNAGFWCILTVNEPFYHSLSYLWLWIFLFLSLARLVSLVFPAVFSALFSCSPVSVSFAASGWLSKCFQARAICTDLVGSLALLWEKGKKKAKTSLMAHFEHSPQLTCQEVHEVSEGTSCRYPGIGPSVDCPTCRCG